MHGFSLQVDQEAAVGAIVALAEQYDVDAVIVAGDVFDRGVPPVESLRLLNDALGRLHAAGRTVVLTAGNHDSGDRLALYADLLREGVHVVGSPMSVDRPIELQDAHGPVLLYALPYLEPDVARVALGEDGPLPRSHAAIMDAALDRIAADISRRGGHRAVVVGHAFVAEVGTETSNGDAGLVSDMVTDSERDLSIGGVQVVPASVFAGRGLSYVALGHLHRPQSVRAAEPVIAYSGSLLRYSLSEATHIKSACVVEVGPSGEDVQVTRVPLPQGRGMARLSGTLAELLGEEFEPNRSDFVELVVTDPTYPERMHARLDEVFPHALRKEHRPEGVEPTGGAARGDARGREPLEVMTDFLAKVTGLPVSDAQRTILAEAYERARDAG